MNVIIAKEIIDKFIAALAKGTKANGIARYQSWLPCSKGEILDAFKIFLSHAVKHNTFPSHIFNKYLESVSYVSSFIDDKDAEIVDEMHALKSMELRMQDKRKAEIFFSYRYDKSSSDHYSQLEIFINEVRKIEKDDIAYCSKVYQLANLRYYPVYEENFNNKYLA